MDLLPFGLIATAIQYLAGDARVLAWPRGKLPPAVVRFLRCAKCSGFWIGVAIDALAPWAGWTSPFAWASGHAAVRALVAGLCALVLVPIGRSLMDLALADEP